MKLLWKLPDDWNQTWMVDGNVVLSRPGGGHVTVDLVQRGFKLGYGVRVSKRQVTNDYVRVGWRDRLFNDAIAALNNAYEDKK